MKRNNDQNERKYQQLQKLGQELKIPTFEAFLEFEVRDGNGKTIHHHRQRSHSWVRNAYNHLFCQVAAKDASEVAKLNSELAKPGVEKLVDYSRSIYDLVTEMQKEITSVMEAQYSSFTKNAQSAVEKATASAPVGGDVFAATMKSMLGASTKAFDQMTSMAKQLSDIAEANMQVATKAAVSAAPAKSATAAAARKAK